MPGLNTFKVLEMTTKWRCSKYDKIHFISLFWKEFLLANLNTLNGTSQNIYWTKLCCNVIHLIFSQKRKQLNRLLRRGKFGTMYLSFEICKTLLFDRTVWESFLTVFTCELNSILSEIFKKNISQKKS